MLLQCWSASYYPNSTQQLARRIQNSSTNHAIATMLGTIVIVRGNDRGLRLVREEFRILRAAAVEPRHAGLY